MIVACSTTTFLAGCGSGEDPDRSDTRTQATERPVAVTPSEELGGEQREPDEPRFRRLEGVTTTRALMTFEAEGLKAWRKQVEGIERITISSSKDGQSQRAFWLPPPTSAGKRPLLVVLHSWSAGYRQEAGIPFAQWADQQGWAMIHPDYRGPFDDPQATGSQVAVTDVLDAVDYAVEEGEVDSDRVFLVGFSGGGMMSLLMAGQHPDRFAGAASWVPVHDLRQWHAYNRDEAPQRDYRREIEASCGGDPARERAAREECRERSPRAHLDAARRAKVPIYIGAGLKDRLVPPDNALRSYNQLADPDDRIGPSALRAVAGNLLPGRLRGSIAGPTFFDSGDPKVLFARRSGPVSVVLFDGRHDLVYNPGLEWMARLAMS